jgi:hypothetical protein
LVKFNTCSVKPAAPNPINQHYVAAESILRKFH